MSVLISSIAPRSTTEAAPDDTINLSFKTAISILLISNHNSFRECCLIKSLSYILFEKYILYFSIGNGQPTEQALCQLCQLYRHTFVPYVFASFGHFRCHANRWVLLLALGFLFVFYSSHSGWLDSRVVSVLDSGTEGPGFKSQSRRCRVTVLGRLFTPIVPLFTKQQNW